MLIQAIILQVIFFIGLVLVLRKVLISSSYTETERLKLLNEENASKAQELNAKISAAENEYREKMLKTDEEIRMLKAKAKKEIEELKEAIIAKGKAEGDRIVTQALNARDEIRAEIEQQMLERAIEVSRKIFERIFSADEQKLVHDGLFENVVKDVEAVEATRLESIDLSVVMKDGIEIRTPHPMSAPQKERLEKVLSRKLGQDVTLREVVVKEIVAGILIAVGSFVIDGTFSARFTRAAGEIK